MSLGDKLHDEYKDRSGQHCIPWLVASPSPAHAAHETSVLHMIHTWKHSASSVLLATSISTGEGILATEMFLKISTCVDFKYSGGFMCNRCN